MRLHRRHRTNSNVLTLRPFLQPKGRAPGPGATVRCAPAPGHQTFLKELVRSATKIFGGYEDIFPRGGFTKLREENAPLAGVAPFEFEQRLADFRRAINGHRKQARLRARTVPQGFTATALLARFQSSGSDGNGITGAKGASGALFRESQRSNPDLLRGRFQIRLAAL